MHKYILIALLLINVIVLPAIVIETGSLKSFIYGHEPAFQYDNWISHLAENIVSPGYNVYAPWDKQTSGFGDFHIPTATELVNWGFVIDAFLIQDWTTAENLIATASFPYQIVQFNDTDSNRTYYMLREIPNELIDDNGTPDTTDDETGAFAWGWGLYIFNPTGDQRTIITVPHPCDDYTTPTLGYIALNTWNASFLMIAGAGREVKWTNMPPYTNSKSLSDPTRTSNHPFYPAYTKFCSKIRTETGKREFSVQLHSYDWSLHTGFASVQISAGYNKMCPNLPIRDLSRFKHDLINQGNHLMIPANTIGSNRNVYINNYYTVQYSVHPFTYSDQDTTYSVNSYMDLPAYSQNVQMNHTLNGWNDYDVYEPFFHIEMSELPNCYTQNDVNYKWFYNWNAATEAWNMNNLFDHTIEYYSYWINDMNAIIGETLAMNDNLAPLPPQNLTVFNQSYDYVTLRWQKSDDYDFDSYEILYGTQPIGEDNYSIFSRNHDAFLASPYCEQVNVTGLANATQIYFKIRARDKNGNYSALSNEVNAITIPVKITNFRGIGMDNQVLVKWSVPNQQNNLGFNLYRMSTNGSYDLMDSYTTNAALLSGNPSYQWADTNVRNDSTYTYKLSCVSTNLIEYYHNVTSIAYPRDYFKLYVSKDDYSMLDSLTFSANPNAGSGNDTDYDISKNNAPSSNYLYGAFWEQYWGSNGTYLSQEVMGDFNPDTEVKTWSIRFKTDQLNVPIVFRIDDSFTRYSEKLYLRDNTTGTMTDLETSVYSFIVTDTNIKSFTLYWGNLQPSVTISSMPNRVYQGGSSQSFYWNTSNSFLVDHYNISIQNETDSLFIVDNLPNSQTSYAVVFPTDISMQNAKFILDAWSADGQLQRKTSAFTFGFVPLNTTINPEPGLYMCSNIWTNPVPSIPTVFGTNSTGWTMNTSGDWMQSFSYAFGTGYWVQKNAPFEYTANSPIQRDSISFALRQGWNIVPNPHICAYRIEELRFRINNVVYNFSDVIDQRLISKSIYAYRDGQYIMTDVIYPYEAFLVKFYGRETMTASINFIPYYSGISFQPPTPIWALKLYAHQEGSDTDELEIGSNLTSKDNFDFKFDLPEPPLKPVFPHTRLYIYRNHDDSLFMDLHLNTDYRSPFSTTELEEKIWNFRIEAGNTNPIEFTVDDSFFPDTYGASIVIGDLNYDIQHGNSFSYTPPEAGSYNGQLVIHNYFTGNEDEVMPSLSGLKVYPNPFNPNTQIIFSTAEKGNVFVDIYNVKGQRVKSLSKGQLGKGTHQMQWNGKDNNNNIVGTGIYLLKVKTNSKTKIIKMMLMK